MEEIPLYISKPKIPDDFSKENEIYTFEQRYVKDDILGNIIQLRFSEILITGLYIYILHYGFYLLC